MLQNPGNIGFGHLREMEFIFWFEEGIFVPFEKGLMGMHATSVLTEDGFGHKGCINTMPQCNLLEAIQLTEKSELVKETLGDHIFQKFIENKKIEWDQYRTHVSQFELDKYLSVL